VLCVRVLFACFVRVFGACFVCSRQKSENLGRGGRDENVFVPNLARQELF